MSRRPLILVLVFHNHQPHGNFDHVLERATDRAYAPLLAALAAEPRLRLGLHYSGTLLDWLTARRPALIERLATLVAAGQVELLTGGYHEPILPVVPGVDRLGQIRSLTQRLSEAFGVQPTGLWLTERVWEPGLALDLAHAGIHYTLVDDAHFQLAGLPPEALYAPYVTEDGGHALRVLASLKPLRYGIPWQPVAEVMAWLRSVHEQGGAMAVMGDDGEKLGLWPRSYDLVWRRGWWRDFVAALIAAEDWLTLGTPSAAIDAVVPAGRVYLPTASYDEMGEWALPPAAAANLHAARQAADARQDPARPFLAGTAWRGFLARYPEANLLHKRMLWAARAVHALPPGPDRRAAQAALWRGQSNCPYWHGVFGGLYLLHLRSANWAALAEASAIARSATPAGSPLSVVRTDFDADGADEVVVDGTGGLLVIAPHDGGTLLAWEAPPLPHNLVFALARRREAYHARLEAAVADGSALVDPGAWADELLGEEQSHPDEEGGSIHAEVVRLREPGLAALIRVDPAPRWAARDRWLPPGAGIADLVAGSEADDGGLLGARWRVTEDPATATRPSIAVRLTDPDGCRGELAACRMVKTYVVHGSTADLSIRYAIAAPAAHGLDGRLAVELSWGLAGGGGNEAALIVGDEPVDLSGAVCVADAPGYSYVVRPADVRVRMTLEPPDQRATLWSYPIETAASSDAGFERSWQGQALVVVWPVTLAPGGQWRGGMRLRVTAMGAGLDIAAIRR